MTQDKTRLMEFYGTECPHCVRMQPLIEKLEQELKVTVERFEVWHNEENAKLMKKIDKDCGGVPFFFNEKSGISICGEVDYDILKEWATS